MNSVLRVGAFICLLSLLAVMIACSQQPIAAGESSVKPAGDRNEAPDFTLTDSDGQAVTLSEYRGQVVLLNFWATWCPPCKIEIPWFTEFERQYKDQGFSVLGVSLDEGGWEDVRNYIERAELNYRVVMGTEEVAMLYGGVEALPQTFLIDREGRIGTVHVGLVSKGEYQRDLNELLNNETASANAPSAVVAGGRGGSAD